VRLLVQFEQNTNGPLILSYLKKSFNLKMSQHFTMNDAIYRSRADWSEYSVFYNRQTPKTLRIVMNSFTLPEPVVGTNKVDELAIVVNSNNGVIGSPGKILAGPGVKQFTFCRNEAGQWVIRGGNNMLEYPSTSTTYTFRLRYLDPISRQFKSFIPNNKLKWEINVLIV
jgi:hypothetical protein